MSSVLTLLKAPWMFTLEVFSTRSAALKIIRRYLLRIAAKILRRYLIHKLEVALGDCKTTQEFEQICVALDLLSGHKRWKEEHKSQLYDHERIEARLDNMRSLRKGNDIDGLLHCLRQDLKKNLGGICDPSLYKVSYIGTKKLIEDYHNEVIRCIQFIYYFDSSKLNLNKKFKFFSETKHSYGNTALFLSGGASFGKYHLGVVKALYENDLLPRIIVGSSVGSIIATMVASMKYNQLWEVFSASSNFNFDRPLFDHKTTEALEFVKLLMLGKPISGHEKMKSTVQSFCGDMTFAEIYEANGWNLNITVTFDGFQDVNGRRQSELKLLNYLTAPNVVIWSAVCASCSMPGLLPAVDLMQKDKDGKIKRYYTLRNSNRIQFVDGSLAADIPTERVAELFNINTYIVS